MVEGVAPPAVTQSVILAATISMAAIPFLAQIGQKLGRKVQTSTPEVPAEALAAPGASGQVLIVGYGRVGRAFGLTATNGTRGFERGERAHLNFGHTFGHAIEAGMGYGAWLHGEAVGCGLVMAARLSQALGLLDAAMVQRLESLVRRAGLPTVAPVLDASDNPARYLELMRVDKKAEAGEIKFILIDGPGRAVVRGAPDGMVASVIEQSCRAA